MPAPLAVAAAAAAARLLAKKAAGKAANKVVSAASARTLVGKPKTSKAAKANARGLKAAQGKSLAPKKYKPDTEGRAKVKRFAESLGKTDNNKKTMRLAALAIDDGRSVSKIKVPTVRKTISGRVINERAKKVTMPKKSK
jgi:hypothetical protein